MTEAERSKTRYWGVVLECGHKVRMPFPVYVGGPFMCRHGCGDLNGLVMVIKQFTFVLEGTDDNEDEA